MLTLLAIVVCVAGIDAYADQRLQASAMDEASRDGTAAAHTLAGRLDPEGDLTSEAA